MQQIRESIITEVRTYAKPGMARYTVDVYRADFSRAVTFTKAKNTITAHSNSSYGSQVVRHATLHVGQFYEIRVVPSTEGYLSLFNLGTSGAIDKMYPLAGMGDNRVLAGIEFALQERWIEQGPTSAVYGLTEVLLFVLTETKREVRLGDLHIDLMNRMLASRGSLGKESDGYASLMQERGVWMDIMEFKVV